MKKLGIVLGIAFALIFSVVSLTAAKKEAVASYKEQACVKVNDDVTIMVDGIKESIVDSVDLNIYEDRYYDEDGSLVIENHRDHSVTKYSNWSSSFK